MVYLIDRLHEVERCSSQYENEEARSDLSSDVDKVIDTMYYEEASCEDNDENFCSSQQEDNGSKCSSSCESDANWEEERNGGIKYSYASKGMSSFSKSKSEVPFQSYVNQLEVES